MADVRAIHNRIGIRLGADPRCRPYSPDVIGTVATQVLLAVLTVAKESGAADRPDEPIGEIDFEEIVRRISTDEVLNEIPMPVVLALLPVVLEIATEEIAR